MDLAATRVELIWTIVVHTATELAEVECWQRTSALHTMIDGQRNGVLAENLRPAHNHSSGTDL